MSNEPSSNYAHRQDDEAARRINRKLDITILPLLSLLYLCNGLDRSNIGNAETQGILRILSLWILWIWAATTAKRIESIISSRARS
jgi:hypothetical protein